MKNKIKMFLIIIIIFSLSGCYNYRELNEITVVSAIGIEKVNDEFKISTQIMNVISKDDSEINKTIVLESYGKTIFEAFRNMTRQTPSKLYIAHVKVLLIDSSVAKTDFINSLDLLLREPETRNEYIVLLAKNNTPSEILKVIDPFGNFQAYDIANSVNSNNKFYGSSTPITFDELISTILKDGIEPSLSSITLKGDYKNGIKEEDMKTTDLKVNFLLSETGIFKDNKLLGYLSKEESKGLKFLNNTINETVIEIFLGCDYIAIEILNSKAIIDVSYKEGYKAHVSVVADGNIAEVNCDVNLKKTETINKIQKLTKDKIKEYINKTIIKTQEKETDVIGIGEIFHKKKLKYFKKVQNNWNDIYKDMQIDVDVKVNLLDKGIAKQSISKLEGKNEK